MKKLCMALALLCSVSAFAHENNVVLITLDGVRTQEFFDGVDESIGKGRPGRIAGKGGEIFTYLWNEYAPQGVVLGDRSRGSRMQVDNAVAISLPGYQNIMAGHTTGCYTNGCDRIEVETLPERIKRELKLETKQVATIASWRGIDLAVRNKRGTAFVNTAFDNINDGTDDPVFTELNARQSQDLPPWQGSRWDRYTFAHAMHYLEKHRPRFMFVSLNDSDDWAHKGNYPNYVASLQQYDQWLRELFVTLDSMGEYGAKTTVIVTTDHGRGNGSKWTDHGVFTGGSKNIWLFGRTPHARGGVIETDASYGHSDIRPTVEAILGLKPLSCKGCGRVIRELL